MKVKIYPGWEQQGLNKELCSLCAQMAEPRHELPPSGIEQDLPRLGAAGIEKRIL